MKKDPYDMSEQEFKEFLDKNTTPEEVFENAKRIYDFMGELFQSEADDSIMRGWTFEWYSDKTNSDYDVIFDKWLSKK